MNHGILIPIIAILASAAVVIRLIAYLQFRQASPSADPAGASENERLARENEVLRRTVERLEERMAVLERIATDPAERTAREIESLR